MIILPTSWEQVSYNQFLEIKEISKDDNIFLQYINILSILTNTNPEDSMWSELGLADLKAYIKQISWINQLPKFDLKNELNLFKLKPNEDLTLGEYLDIDYYFTNNYLENLPKIAAIYYRHYKHDEYDNILLETYQNIDIGKRAIEFGNNSVLLLLPLIQYFNEYKLWIVNNNPNLFVPILDNEEGLDEEDLNDPIVQQEIAKEKLLEAWSWEHILHKLTNGDITKNNSILDLPFIMILNQLAFRKQFNLD